MHNKSVVGFLGFFAALALLVPYARAHGMGMGGVFFAIIGAGVVAIGVPWVFKVIGLALRQRGLSWRVLGAFMVGGYEIPVTASTRTVEASPLYLEAPGVAQPLTEDDARFIAESNAL
jgi:hypothetical protein